MADEKEDCGNSSRVNSISSVRSSSMFSFIRPSFFQKKKSKDIMVSSEKRIQSMHDRIEELNNGDQFRRNDNEISSDIEQSVAVKKLPDKGKKKKKEKGTKRESDLLQKSQKMKQLEEFDRIRVAKEREKRRKEQIEREATKKALEEIAELEALQAEEEELSRIRKQSAQYWTNIAREQKAEAENYERYMLCTKENRKMDNAMGGNLAFKPNTRMSYEEWLVADESKWELHEQASAEEQATRGICPGNLLQQLPETGRFHDIPTGKVKYDANMFADNDEDDDDLGGTTSSLTEAEVACGMNFDKLHEYECTHEGERDVDSSDIGRMMQPDWMNRVVPPSGRSWFDGVETSGEVGKKLSSCEEHFGQVETKAVINQKKSIKSAISEYNASRKRSHRSKKNLDAGSKSSKSREIHSESDRVTDADVDKLKSDLKMFQVEEELKQLQIKHKNLQSEVEEVEDVIEKIDKKLDGLGVKDIDNKEQFTLQLNKLTEKLENSQKAAEKKKDFLDDMIYNVEKEMKEVSAKLKSLRGQTLIANEDKTLRLPAISKHHIAS